MSRILQHPFEATEYQRYIEHHRDKRAYEASVLWLLLLQWLDKQRRGSRELSVLDVGCGDGSLAQEILRECLRRAWNGHRPTRLHLTLVDPDTLSLRQARMTFGTGPVLFCGLDVQAMCKRLEDLPCRGATGPFDVILCSHVLYYVAEWKTAVDSLLKLLSPNGRLFIILASSAGSIFSLHAHCLQRSGLPEENFYPYYGEDLERILAQSKLAFQTRRCKSKLSFPPSGDGTEIAAVLSFLYHCPVEACLSVLRNETDALWTEHIDNGTRLATYDDLIFEIPARATTSTTRHGRLPTDDTASWERKGGNDCEEV